MVNWLGRESWTICHTQRRFASLCKGTTWYLSCCMTGSTGNSNVIMNLDGEQMCHTSIQFTYNLDCPAPEAKPQIRLIPIQNPKQVAPHLPWMARLFASCSTLRMDVITKKHVGLCTSALTQGVICCTLQ